MKKGLIQVYTGDGKGKTTASVGLAVRALARGLKVCYASFHKKPFYSGEMDALKKLKADLCFFAPAHPSFGKKYSAESARRECLDALGMLRAVFKKKYDLIVIDELNICVRDGYLKEKEILDLLDNRPAGTEVVLTGRGATKGIIKKADLVSHIKCVKHPYDAGTKQRKGIEY